jgi:hypothetical protein
MIPNSGAVLAVEHDEAPNRFSRPAPFDQTAPKIAHMTQESKNRPHDTTKNRPHDTTKNRLNIINPVRLIAVIREAELGGLLKVHDEPDWSSRVRLRGLMLLIDYLCRNLKNGSISISADLAHQFVSKLRNRSRDDVSTEPLLLLCRIGILERIRPAVFAHLKTSAGYRFANRYRNKRRVDVILTPLLARKRELASQRREHRLSRRYPFRGQLLRDLQAVSFAPQARAIIAKEIIGKGFNNLNRIIAAIDGHDHSVRVSERGQVTTTISSCPKELQPHLLLNSEPIVSCDISHAHWNFLPLILANRLRRVSQEAGREKYIIDGWREHGRLIALLSERDFYSSWCLDPTKDTERGEKKAVLNIVLNKRNNDCRQNRLYRRIAAEFPITLAVIEDIKRNDHRNLSKQLHRFTADAIAGALLEVQRKEIAAIPHVDALICRKKDRSRVCEAIGRQIFQATGVFCTVGGIRYSPLNEIAQTDDDTSYDGWEAMRLATAAAGKSLDHDAENSFASLTRHRLCEHQLRPTTTTGKRPTVTKTAV